MNSKAPTRVAALSRSLLVGFTLLAGASIFLPLAAQESAPPSLNPKAPKQTPAPQASGQGTEAAPCSQSSAGTSGTTGSTASGASGCTAGPGSSTASGAAGSPAASGISTEPPSIPAEQIIQRFAEREGEFQKERDNFTYTQTFVVQTIDDDGQPDGEYRMTSDVTFLPSGERYEKITNAPPPTLERVMLTEQDLNDLKNIQPFVLTSEELPKYDITYVGREKVDELSTYVFDVKPKKIEKNQRYFEGRVWVDDQDLEIVKTYGKAVPDIRKGGTENFFPRFETYRENIEGHYWFPTYTHADDVLHFSSGAVHLRMTVRYTDYKRFRSSYRLVPTDQNKPQNP